MHLQGEIGGRTDAGLGGITRAVTGLGIGQIRDHTPEDYATMMAICRGTQGSLTNVSSLGFSQEVGLSVLKWYSLNKPGQLITLLGSISPLMGVDDFRSLETTISPCRKLQCGIWEEAYIFFLESFYGKERKKSRSFLYLCCFGYYGTSSQTYANCYNFVKLILMKIICIKPPVLFLITVMCNNEVYTPKCHCKFYLIVALNLIYKYICCLSVVCWLHSIVVHWQLKKYGSSHIPSSMWTKARSTRLHYWIGVNCGISFEQSVRGSINIHLMAEAQFIQALLHAAVFRDTWFELWHVCICEIISHSLNQDLAALQMLEEGLLSKLLF